MKQSTKISVEEIKQYTSKGYKLIDIREKSEVETVPGIEGALNIPYSSLISNPKQYLDDVKQPLLLICRSGRRTKALKKTMNSLGYLDVVDVNGGMTEYLKEKENNEKS